MPTTGTWSTVEVAGHDCHVYEPPAPSPHGFVVIYLHGVHLGRLSDHPPFCREFDRHGLRVICPVTQRSWWTDRICTEFDPEITAERYVLDRVVPHVAERWSARPPRIGLLGTSMGGQGALRLAYKHPNTFPVVAALAPAIDYQLRIEYDFDETLSEMYTDPEEARQDTALLHIHPLNWPRHQFYCCDPADERWWNSADRLAMKLSSLGVPFESDLETSAGGHGFDYYNHMAERAVGFLAERLERERLRV
jgi:S-formylglutathione hydrolase FrmB